MAAALARHILGEGVYVESAGTDADEGAFAATEAVQTMQEWGLDISPHRSRPLSALHLHDFDLIIALTPTIARSLRDRGADPSRVRELDIPDPYGMGPDAYWSTALAIERDLRRLFHQWREERWR